MITEDWAEGVPGLHDHRGSGGEQSAHLAGDLQILPSGDHQGANPSLVSADITVLPIGPL